jgi:hypothetical protein
MTGERMSIQATMLKAAEDAPTKIEVRDISKSMIDAPLLKTLDSINKYDADWMPVVAFLLNKYPGRAVKAKSRQGLNGHLGKEPDGTRQRLYEVI